MKLELHEWLQNYANPEEFQRMVRLLLQRHIAGYQSNDDSRGDDGADGFSFEERTIYQIWCPEHLADFQKNARKKITDDLKKLVRFRERVPGTFVEWYFITTRDLDNITITHLRKKAQGHNLKGRSVGRNQLISWLLHSPDIAEQFIPWPVTFTSRKLEDEVVNPLFAWLDSVGAAKARPLLACSAAPMRRIEIPLERLEEIAKRAHRPPSPVGEFDERNRPARINGALSYLAPKGVAQADLVRYWRLNESGLFFCGMTGLLHGRPSTLAPLEHNPVPHRFIAVEKIIQYLFHFADYLAALKTSLDLGGFPVPGFNVRLRLSNEIRKIALDAMLPNTLRILPNTYVADVDPLMLYGAWTRPQDQVLEGIDRMLWHFHHPRFPPDWMTEIRQNLYAR